MRDGSAKDGTGIKVCGGAVGYEWNEKVVLTRTEKRLIQLHQPNEVMQAEGSRVTALCILKRNYAIFIGVFATAANDSFAACNAAKCHVHWCRSFAVSDRFPARAHIFHGAFFFVEI